MNIDEVIGLFVPEKAWESVDDFLKRTNFEFIENMMIYVYFKPLNEWKEMLYGKYLQEKAGIHGNMYTTAVIAYPPVPPPWLEDLD